MRLTASRQPPKDITRPKQPRQPKQNPDPLNNIYPQPSNDCKPSPTKAGKIESTGMHNTPYGGAVREPSDPVYPKYLLELPTLTTGTSKNHMFPDAKANNHLPAVPMPTYTQQQIETSGAVSPDNEMRPRAGAGMSALLPTLGDRRHSDTAHATCSARTQEQTGTHHPGELDSGKRQSNGEAKDGVRLP